MDAQANSLTDAQRAAVIARGNVLVMAGAGTGKTKTLVERCLDCLERDGARLEELLIVTFTEAAAAEMRERLRHAIEARAQAETDAERIWSEQLARLDLAHIGTLHSFCLGLVREHFYELGLDPRLSLLDEGEARQLANETLQEQFAAHYAGENAFSLAVQDLIRVHGGGRDEAIRHLVLRLHNYSQTRPDAAGWLAAQRESFATADPAAWREWLRDALVDWRHDWLPVLESMAGQNEKAAELARILARSQESAGATVMAEIAAAGEVWPKGRKTILRKPLENFFAEAQFLRSLLVSARGPDPLAEDWSWIRGHIRTILQLAEEFAARLADSKRTGGTLDFHDLEQFALQLIWNFSTGQPTAVAEQWRQKFKFVFVDEYQDINAAQDKIIQGLSRSGDGANRFLVGDVKQSIYRFRLADPKIFRDYARQWHGDHGKVIPLSENFRSRGGLLELTNSIFELVMREEIGGVAYDAEARLKFGAPAARPALSLATESAPCAELLVRFKTGRAGRDDVLGPLAQADDTQWEARLVAQRLKQLVAGGHRVFDSRLNSFRPVAWRDIAILLRSPRGRSDVFAKEFKAAGIPLAVARGGFYESAEILDLLSLLQLLDNPLQDVPCIAVLRSPLVGLSLDDLAEIRLAAREHYWTALNRSREAGLSNPESHRKVITFLDRFARWRRRARLVSLSQCLDEILADTLYLDWLRAQPRGTERAAGVTAFLHLAHQFDQLQRQGLSRFLQFINAQQEAGAEPEFLGTAAGEAVSLMSIHQSKGLEFPVVVLADLSKQFNEQDLRDDIIFDEQFGVCPKVKPPHVGRRYPSLPYWLAQRRQRRELRGEELRLLYVALTRARDHLILTATVSEKNWDEIWTQPQPVSAHSLAAARSMAEWLAVWFSRQPRAEGTATGGRTPLLDWRVVPDAGLIPDAGEPQTSKNIESPTPPFFSADDLAQLRSRLEWTYPFTAATAYKAKSSVTALRREADELDEEAQPLAPRAVPARTARRVGRKSKLSAAEIGAAHHKFLENFALDNVEDLAAEADRLVQGNYLTAEERAALDLSTLGAFWHSSLGRKILAHPDAVRRELPFTARFSPLEVAQITGAMTAAALREEFIIVQGVADLVILLPDEIWLVDFKTDAITARELPEKVKTYTPQIQLYAAALEKIFARKVTVRVLHFLALGETEKI